MKASDDMGQSTPNDVTPMPKRAAQRWWVAVLVTVLVVILGFIAIKYAGWSAGLADSKSPLIDSAATSGKATPEPTVAANDTASRKLTAPSDPAAGVQIDPSLDANGFLIVSESTLAAATSALLASTATTTELTFPGDPQACLTAAGVLDPLRGAQEISWAENDGKQAEAWLIVAAKTPMSTLKANGGLVQTIIMPRSCGQVPASAAVSALPADAGAFFTADVTVQPIDGLQKSSS